MYASKEAKAMLLQFLKAKVKCGKDILYLFNRGRGPIWNKINHASMRPSVKEDETQALKIFWQNIMTSLNQAVLIYENIQSQLVAVFL